MLNKTSLRKYFSQLRDETTCFDRNILDKNITDNIIKSDLYMMNNVILAYSAIKSEPDMSELINYSLCVGKTIALPVCEIKTKELYFYKIKSLNELKKSSYGITEPKSDEDNLIDCSKPALCIIPALAYDKYGFRLGYGGGYYDRFLKQFTQLTSLGICYGKCFTDSLIAEEHDRKVNYIITENEYTEVCNAG